MNPRQIAVLLIHWLGFTVFCVLGVWAAMVMREEIGWFAVISAWVIAFTVFLWMPALVAFRSSGKWYSPSRFQPVLEHAPESLVWRTTTRHLLVPMLLLTPSAIGVAVVELSGALDDSRLGPLMPLLAAVTLFVTAIFLLRLCVQNTVAEIQSNSFTLRANELPFVVSIKRVYPVEEVYFAELVNPLPKGCLLTLTGTAETIWLLFGKPLHRSTTRLTRIPVPHFANAAPDEFDELLNQYLSGKANARPSATGSTQH